jgi:prevent-host-death family protein
MKSITISELRSELGEVLSEARHGHERIVVTSRGRIVGAVIGPDDLELLEHLEDAEDVEASALALAEPGESVPIEAVRKRLGL